MVWALPTNSFRIVRRVLGAVLLIAAALKGYAVATEPIIGTGILSARWFAIAVVNVELFCGMWLLTDWLPVWTWRGAVALFSLFALVSVSKIIAGEASCGCFGRVPVSPWWTLGFDLAAIGGLVWSRPVNLASEARDDRHVLRAYATTAAATAFLAIAVPANVLLESYRPSVLEADGVIVGDSGVVVLEPEKWVGKPFPLLKYIDIGDQLANGKWRVLFYRHECPKCQELLDILSKTSSQNDSAIADTKTALIQIPPYGPVGPALARAFQAGQLSSEVEWLAETPLEVRSDNTTVISAYTVALHTPLP